MTLYEFIAMNDQEKAREIACGIFLAERQDDQHKIMLYQVGDFYVEVFRDIVHYEIRRFRPFRNLRLLDPYLDDIPIPEF